MWLEEVVPLGPPRRPVEELLKLRDPEGHVDQTKRRLPSLCYQIYFSANSHQILIQSKVLRPKPL